MKKWGKRIVITILVLALLTFSLIGPVDDRPITNQDFYRQTMSELASFRPADFPSKEGWKTAWASVNITPSSPMPMAGYAPRYHFESVHDSLYVRLLALSNGKATAIIISADLLIFPPALRQKIEALNYSHHFLYFTATHVHSSLGAWNDSVIGNLILGQYNDEWLNQLAGKITTAIQSATHQLQPSVLSYYEADAKEYVENRIDPVQGSVDGILRGFKISRNDGTQALLIAYSGHPTNISHLSRALSGDYPGALMQQAQKNKYQFAMFIAGMIGSHRTKFTSEHEFVYCDSLGQRLYRKIESATATNILPADMQTGHVPFYYGPSQLHLLQKWKVRDWVFRLLFQKLEGGITYLKLGHLLMLGMPCDFSGEIFTDDHLGQIAEKKGEKLFITSFNGHYVGYITADKHYGYSQQEEVMALNWVGPHFGNYYSSVIQKILEK
ncbi:MAG: neutral/alkaline non-lysosomal ceramidase N-terminal domain-containing protein [Bacteroidetes bacterium]|nr:neutral/alkaline non-lysosomal ceramidase N-terminal domain-containing protein [Bacteroidota bacterium]